MQEQNMQMGGQVEPQKEQKEQKTGGQNIEGLLEVAMENLNGICQVNTVVGEPVLAGETTIIPISKVSLGFVAGGGEYGKTAGAEPAFGGGSGGGLTVAPVGFLTSSAGGVMRYISVGGEAPLEKALEMAPGLLAKLEQIVQKPRPKTEPSMPKNL